MNPLQEHQLWIGFGLVLLLVIFLMVAFFAGKKMTEQQYIILKMLSALCAAFAGALITGDALFKLQGTIGPGAKYFISGTSGFALFFVVWFFFPPYPKTAQLTDGIVVSVPKGWTFQQTVDILVQRDSAVPSYEGFKDEELNAPLKPWQVKTKNTGDAIRLLRSITRNPDAIRAYDVRFENSTYHLCVRN